MRVAIPFWSVTAACTIYGSIACRTTPPDNLRTNPEGGANALGHSDFPVLIQPSLPKVPSPPVKRTEAPFPPPDVTPPLAGGTGQLKVSGLSSTGALLEWTAGQDDRSRPEKLAYMIYWSGKDDVSSPAGAKANGTVVVAVTPTAAPQLATRIEGMVGGVTYWLNVLVVDEAGNSNAYKSTSITAPASPSMPDIIAHGRQCAARLGKIPAFNCFDGIELPVAVDGVTMRPDMSTEERGRYNFATSPQQGCDRPALLSLGDQGRCVPFSRVGRLQSIGADGTKRSDVDTVFTCRRYRARLAGDTWQGSSYDGRTFPGFEDIAVIQHNRTTGESCFFQMLKAGYAPMDGRRVPPPDEETLPAGSPSYAVKSQEFWMAPADTAAKNCNRCHDVDPWIHSPYIDQARNGAGELVVPRGDFGSGRSGKYSVLGAPFAKWDQVYAVSSKVTTDTKGNSCTSCHEVGSIGGCSKWTPMSTGRLPMPNGTTTTGQGFHYRTWMPPSARDLADATAWKNEGWERATQRLIDCCGAPDDSANCERRPVLSAPPLYPVKNP